MKLTILLTVLALAYADEDQLPERRPVKRSYVCPPNFIRLSHKCYYFSRDVATWQDAYYKCRDLHSNLAIIRNANQDKLIRRTLGKKTLAPLERWLGGLYDWEQMTWKWAASGKPVTYQGFSRMETEDKEKLRWHCIIVDPKLQYKWNTRSCLEEKHFICHTKIKIVTNKGKKKLLRQYNVDKYNKLNEIPVPELPEDLERFKNGNLNNFEISNDLNAQYATKPKIQRKRNKNSNRKRKYQEEERALQDQGNHLNSTQVLPTLKRGNFNGRRRRTKGRNYDKDLSMERLKWKTYYKDVTLSPLHPKAIVEEFNYVHE